MLAAILPPDNMQNRFEHTPGGVLQAKNHRVARLQAGVDRSVVSLVSVVERLERWRPACRD
jgi:hypothetical protein